MAEGNNQRDEVFSKSVRAGKRTYFFDVKSTRSSDYYLTITESKRKTGDDGTPIYEKHKIFLYREDFEKFLDGFNECAAKINQLRADAPPSSSDSANNPEQGTSGFTNVNFDDLG